MTDDSFLTIARLLHNIVGRVSDVGSILNGKELGHALQAVMGEKRVTYGPRKGVISRSGYTLVIGEDVIPRSQLKGGRHPNGSYR